jgi:branched-chain amino acid transport system substrate-binding protein
VQEDANLDSLSHTEAAVGSALYLADIGVPALIGPASSNDVEAVFTEFKSERRDVLIISPSATSPMLTALRGPVSDAAPGLLWRTAPPDSLQGRAIAFDMLNGRGVPAVPVPAVAIIYERGAYGDALVRVFTSNYNGQVMSLPFDGTAYTDQVSNVAPIAIPEVLFISSQSQDISRFLQAAGGLNGFTSAPAKHIFLTDAAANSDVLNSANAALFSNVRGTRPAPLNESNPPFRAFKASYLAFFGDDPTRHSYAANAFDAAYLVAYGAAFNVFSGQPIGGTNMARGLRRVSAGMPVEVGPIQWELALGAFRAGQTIDVKGASGELNYDPIDEETRTDIEVWTPGLPQNGYMPHHEYD